MTVGPKDPRVDFVFLASQVGPAAPGSQLLDVHELGLHDIYLPGAFPSDFALIIVGRLQWRAKDADNRFRITYAVRAFNPHSPQPTLLHSDPVEGEPRPSSPFPYHEAGLYPAQFLSSLIIRVTGYGTYVADVLLDGEVIASEPFAVLPPPTS